MAVRLLAAVGADPKRLYAAVVRRINETPRTAAKEGNRMLRADARTREAHRLGDRHLHRAARAGRQPL